ncbi:MAG: nucleoside-diphosphate kinase [Elusimicrobiota bacterium]
MLERTCVIIKPDGLCKKLAGKIIDRLYGEELNLVAMKMIRFSKERAEKFYSVHIGKQFFPLFLKFVTSAPVIVMVWEGKGCIEKVRNLNGATDSRIAAKGTLRQLWGTDNRRNLVHSSDSLKSAEYEIGVLFEPGELYEYSPTDWDV